MRTPVAFVLAELSSMEGFAAAWTAILLGLLWVLLRRSEQRRYLRMPTICLGLHALMAFVRDTFAAGTALVRPLAVVALILLLVALARVAFLLVVDWLLGQRLGRPMPRIFRDILQGVVFLMATLIVFRAMGVELGSLLTTSAILTAVIGLSLQETLGNLLAGLAVHAERPFEVGDWVQFGEGSPVVGQVVEINWRATKVRTSDLVEVVVPNGIIAKSTIQNFRRPSAVVRRTVRIQLGYDVTPNRVRDCMIEALRGCPGVLVEPAPRVLTAGFADSGIDYDVMFFIDDFAARRDIDSQVRDNVLYALARVGVAPPYPVRDVRILQAQTPVPVEGSFGRMLARLGPAERAFILEGADFFNLLPGSVLADLAEHAVPLLYGRGESIVLVGDRADDLFVVVEGEVAVVEGNWGGGTAPTAVASAEPGSAGETVLARLTSGHVFGELSLLTGVRGATVRVVRDAVVLRIEHRALKSSIEQVPGLRESIATRLVERKRPPSTPDGRAAASQEAEGAVRFALFDRIRRLFSSD